MSYNLCPRVRSGWWLLLVATLALANSANAQNIQSFSWKAAAAPNVSTASWSNAQISAFINATDPKRIAVSTPMIVTDFGFYDLAGDGNLELIAVDPGERGYTSIAVVHRSGTGFSVAWVSTIFVRTVSELVAHLRNDSSIQLLIPRWLTNYNGARAPIGRWTAIYTWSGAQLVDSTSAFREYYRSTIVPKLKSQLIDALSKSGPDSADTLVAKVEYDKAQRTSGDDPTAGVNDAFAWTSSADVVHRLLAVAVLRDIGTPAAKSSLESLSGDADASVAGDAAQAVAKWQH